MAYTKMHSEDEMGAVTGKKPSSLQKENWSGTLDKIIEWSFIGLVFLMPVFFLPFTTEVLELNKQMLLFVATLWLGLLFTTRIVVTGSFEIKRSPLYWGFLAFFVAWALATAFSIYPYNSILGLERQEFLSLSTIGATFVLLFVLGNVGTPRLAGRLVSTLLISSALVTIEGLLQLFGVFPFPWDFTKTTSFSPVGLFNVWGVLGVGTLLLGVNELVKGSFSTSAKKTLQTVALGLFSALQLLLLLILDDNGLWLALIAGLIVLLGVLYMKLAESQKIGWLILPCFLIVLSVTLMIVNPPRIVSLPLSPSLTLKASADITTSALKASPFFGYGPGNFLSIYTKHRPQEINQVNLMNLWTVRFDQSTSYLLTKVAETGVVGILGMLALIVLVVLQIVGYLKKRDLDQDYLTFLGVSSALAALLVSAVMKPSNMTLTFVWWLLVGIVLVYTAKQGKAVSGNQSNKFVILSSLALYTLVALGFVGIVFAGTRYSADLAFSNALIMDKKLGLEASKQGKAVETTQIDPLIQGMGRAIQADPRNHLYPRVLSQTILVKLSRLISEAKTEQDARAALQALPSQAVAAAQLAVNLNKQDVRNLENLASTYQSVLPFAADAEKLASDTYKKIVEINPTDPMSRLSFARMYLDGAVLHKKRAADEKASEEVKKKESAALKESLDGAEKYLNEAIELKKDFAPAYFHLATIKAEQGKKEEAVKNLDIAAGLNAQLASLRSADEGLFYLTGLAYASLDEKDRASDAFRAAFTLRPSYALAIWNYAILQADKGNKDEAIRALELILQLDKDNKTVQDKLKELKGEAPAPAAEAPKEEKK